jgi:hypothetical protein
LLGYSEREFRRPPPRRKREDPPADSRGGPAPQGPRPARPGRRERRGQPRRHNPRRPLSRTTEGLRRSSRRPRLPRARADGGEGHRKDGRQPWVRRSTLEDPLIHRGPHQFPPVSGSAQSRPRRRQPSSPRVSARSIPNLDLRKGDRAGHSEGVDRPHLQTIGPRVEIPCKSLLGRPPFADVPTRFESTEVRGQRFRFDDHTPIRVNEAEIGLSDRKVGIRGRMGRQIARMPGRAAAKGHPW